ncbi:helix-turn-helix domain-containing protein [Fulvivirgaceae bacterium LMO-SS25]
MDKLILAMDLNYNLLNIIMLFGAIQGFILCVFIYKKNITNKLSARFFLLFLFSLAFYNLTYALLDMDVFKYYRPLHLFPYPYKWLIGIGFYFYIKNQFQSNDGIIYHKKEWYIIAPAVIYALLRTYWFSISVSENSYRITKVIVDSNFFRVHEFFYQFFTIALLIASLKILKKNSPPTTASQKHKDVFAWLKRLTLVFLSIIILDIALFSVDLILHNWIESINYSYPTFILNTLLIYWIGYVGFLKPKLFFDDFGVKEKHAINDTLSPITEKLNKAITNSIYTNPNLSLTDFAIKVETTPKELSRYINEVHQMNFSEFITFHRVEKVKQLLKSSDAERFTLVALAENAGFSSKSSFNTSFKKMVGMTPSAYKKQNTSHK